MQETPVQFLGWEDSPGEGNGIPATPVFLPGKSHGQRSLAGYSPWDLKELDTTEQLSSTLVTLKSVLPYISITVPDLTNFYWSIVDLQYCVSFRQTAK